MLQQTCRTCATLFDENTILIPAFDKVEVITKTNNEFRLADELLSLNVQIEKDDGFPQQVCIKCVKQLTTIHNFRQQCKEAQDKLRECFIIRKTSPSPDVNLLESEQLLNETIVDESEMIISNPENLGKVESVLENSDDFTIGEEVSMIEEMEDTTENGIQIIFNEDDEVNDEVEYLDDTEYESKSLIEEDQSESVENMLTMNESTMDEQSQDQYIICNNNEETTKIIMCPRCKYYKHASRFKLDKYICMRHKLYNNIQDITSDSEFHCFYCHEKFQSMEIIEDHILKSHPIETPFQCKTCSKYFETTSKRKLHMERDHKEVFEKYYCEICGKEFKDKYKVQKHSKAVHPDGNYECSVCFQKFTNALKFNYHLKSHDKIKRFKCRFCDKSFIQAHHIQFHEESHTDIEKPLSCDICGKRYLHDYPYRTHVKKHEGIKPHKCDDCGKGFRAKFMLNRHKMYHNFEFQCEYCGKTYNSMSALQLHRSSHDIEMQNNPGKNIEKNYRRKYYLKKQLEHGKFYTCPICSKKFDIPSALEKHMHVHDQNRKFKCDICGNFYKTAYHLQSHVNRAHLKDKNYDCIICGKLFFDPGSLSFHVKSHTERYECSYCKKMYSKKYIKHHELKHTKIKDYVCKICGSEFNQITQLREHYLKHTPEEKKEIEAKILANNMELITKSESLD